MFFAGYCFSDSAIRVSEKKDFVQKAEKIDDVKTAEKIEDEFCSLVIESNAFNAEVYINGIFKGFTTLELKGMRPGRYFIEVVKSGYERERFEVRLRRGESKEVYVNLKLITGYIEFLNYPSGASVSVDGSIYSNKKIVEVAAGRHRVNVSKFGYESLETYVDVLPYKTTGVSIELEPAAFYVNDFEVSKKRINPNVNGLSSCEISFYVSANGNVSIKVENEVGEVVNQFDFFRFTTWYNHVDWNGTDAAGKIVADGTYKIVLESVTGKFEDFVVVDSSMRYPVESFTSCGGGIGNYGTVFDSTMRTVRPSFGFEPIFKLGKENAGFYGAYLETGVLFDIGKYVECGITINSLLENQAGSEVFEDDDLYVFPFGFNASVKVSNSVELGNNVNFGFGGFVKYGFSNVFVESKLNKGLGFGGLLGIEFSKLYAGLSSEFVFGSQTGKVGIEENIWKNALTIRILPTSFMGINAWCGLNNFDLGFNTNPKNGRVKALSKACLDRTYSLDCGLEYVVVPGAGGFTLDFGVNLLLYFNSDAYLSGKLVLSYSF